MPALKLFNRRWLIAGDDVPAPAAFLAVFHIIWIALSISWIIEIRGPAHCQGINPYYVAVDGLLASFIIAFILELAAIIVGLRGSIFETRKRASLPTIIYATILSFIAQIAFNAYATYLLYSDPPECPTASGDIYNPNKVLRGMVWSTWALIAGLIGFGIAAYNLFPNYKDPHQWQNQCACLGQTCCPCGSGSSSFDRKSAGRRIGSLFSLMLSHIDFTPSDVVTSFILTLNEQRVQRRLLAKMNSRRKNTSGSHGNSNGGDSNNNSNSHSITTGGATRATNKREAFSTNNSSIQEKKTSLSMGSIQQQQHNDLPSLPSTPTSHDGLVTASSSSIDYDDTGSIDDIDDDYDVLGVVDYDSLAEATYYMKYAFAVYGWMLFVWNENAVGCCKLCFGRGCGMWTGMLSARYGPPVISHSSPYFNTEAILQAAHLKEQDLIVHRSEGEIPNVLPYFIAIDHEKKAVVLSIRGSLSFDDVLRDLMYEPAELDAWLNDEQSWDTSLPPVQPAIPSSSRYAAHSGILEAARATLEDIRRGGHLQRLLSMKTTKDNSSSTADNTNTTTTTTNTNINTNTNTNTTKEYRLVICGHSLGAGCAFLVSLYLRNYFPDLHCFAFSPPGGLASADLCAAATEWCTTIVCGKEMIPRITLATFERMRDEFVHTAALCKMPKLKLLANSLIGKVYARKDLFYSTEELPDEPRQWLEEYHASLDATVTKRAYLETAAQFGPPGRVMHLRPTGRKHKTTRPWFSWLRKGSNTTTNRSGGHRGYGVEREYRCVWIDGQKLVDQGILLSGRMMSDHFPDYCLALMRKLTESAARDESRATISDDAEVLNGYHHNGGESGGGGMNGGVPEIRIV